MLDPVDHAILWRRLSVSFVQALDENGEVSTYSDPKMFDLEYAFAAVLLSRIRTGLA